MEDDLNDELIRIKEEEEAEIEQEMEEELQFHPEDDEMTNYDSQTFEAPETTANTTVVPAIQLSGNNAQRTLWVGDVPSDWSEDTLNQVFTECNHPPYKVKRVYVDKTLKPYCFVEFMTFEEARDAMFDLNGCRIRDSKKTRFNLCFANDSYNPNSEFNLHVSSLPSDLSDAELYRIFDKYPSCRGAKMFRFSDGSSKGCGFVRFGDQTDQQTALLEQDRKRVGTKRIILLLAGPRGERLDKPYGKKTESRRSDYRNGSSSQTSMYDSYAPQQEKIGDIYGTDNPWAPLPDDHDLDPIIGLDLLPVGYRPQIFNKRVMIDPEQFMFDLESSRWSSIVFNSNIKESDLEERLAKNPWTPIP